MIEFDEEVLKPTNESQISNKERRIEPKKLDDIPYTSNENKKGRMLPSPNPNPQGKSDIPFWKIFGSFFLVVMLITVFYWGSVWRGIELKQEVNLPEQNNAFNSETTVNNDYEHEITNNISNYFNFNLDIDEELIAKFCNESS